MQALGPFVLGVLFAALACLQHTHSVRGLWIRSMATSLCIGAIQFMLVRWAARGDSAFWILQAGCCAGAGLGCYFSKKLIPNKESATETCEIVKMPLKDTQTYQTDI